MLENVDLHLIYRLVQEAGYELCHFYAERTITTDFEINDKECKSRHSESGGLSIQLQKKNEEKKYTFRTQQFSTQSILELLNLPFTFSPPQEPLKGPNSTPSLTGKKLQNLQLLIRKINLDNAISQPVSCCFQEKQQTYQSATAPGEIKSGEYHLGDVTLVIETLHKGTALNFSHQLSSTNLEGLWEQLQQLISNIQRRILLGCTEQWPVPSGPIAVGWSSQSIAKMTDCFLRGFEGDLVLKNFSYLTQLSLPLNYNFTIEEMPPPANQNNDHEGSDRKPLIIFDGKKPRGLATDKTVAQEFSVASTGHSRRESFEHPSTIGFWHPTIKGTTEVDSVLPLLTAGLWVEELEIKEFDLVSGTGTLYFSQVNLVHEGAIGESVAPFFWTVSLPEIMGSLTHFSNQTSTLGLFHTKQKQRVLTEFTAPSALSSELDLPGSVPKSHYW